MARSIASIKEELRKAEEAIDAAELSGLEAWCTIAAELKRIRGGLYKGDGLKTWEEYCRSEQARYSKQHANRMIKALAYRRVLPRLSKAERARSAWSQRAVEQLTKLSTPVVAKSCAALIVAHCKEEGVRLTEKLVKSFVDETLLTAKEQRAQAKLHAEKLSKATPGANLNQLLTYTQKHHQMLASLPDSFFTEAEKASPGICGRVAKALRELASFLES